MRKSFLSYARYMKQTDEKVFALLESLPLEARNENRGSYYGSLHGLSGHIVSATIYFHGLFRDSMPERKQLFAGVAGLTVPAGVLTAEEFFRLREICVVADDLTIGLVESLHEEEMHQPVKLDWYADRERVPFHFLFNQMIVHGIHHRGQISQLLDELKVEHDFSGIDIEFLPPAD